MFDLIVEKTKIPSFETCESCETMRNKLNEKKPVSGLEASEDLPEKMAATVATEARASTRPAPSDPTVFRWPAAAGRGIESRSLPSRRRTA